MRRTPLPHRLTPVYLYSRWDLNPQRFPLGCWFLKPVRFYRFATEAYYFVALVGNDPTTFSMSRKCSPIWATRHCILSRWRDSNPRCFYSSLQGKCCRHWATSAFLRSRLGSNQREWVCNPLPPVFLHHSATGPFVLLSVRVTIPPPLVYQTSALPNELTDNFNYTLMYLSFLDIKKPSVFILRVSIILY